MARPRHIVVVQSSYLDLADRFYQHLLRQGYHPKSSRSKYNYICEFLHWLEQKGTSDITKVSPKQINDYYNYLFMFRSNYQAKKQFALI